MKKVSFIFCVIMSSFYISCNDGINVKEHEVNIKKSKDSTLTKKINPVNLEYQSNYFLNSLPFYKGKDKSELKEELQFLDYNVAFFKFDTNVLNLNIDSLFAALYIRAFEPSDNEYYSKTCLPKSNEKDELIIKEYGNITKYSFVYQSKPACNTTKPTLIINQVKKEIIIIESNEVLIKNNSKDINIIFSTRGNTSSYNLYYNGVNFAYKNI